MKIKTGSILFFTIISGYCFGQERYFARTYNTAVSSKGDIDLEFWHTSRLGHQGEYFHAQNQRLELEFGLGNNVQTAFYFNRFQNTSIDSLGNNTTAVEIGFSIEWKWKLSDPIDNMVGSALYSEIGWKGDEIELETKLILDKQFGKNLLAFNLVAEIEEEIERENGNTRLELDRYPVEFDFAYMRNFSKNLGIGFELINHNDISKHNGWENSIWFAGPTFNYRSNKWYLIANFLPQLGNIHKTKFSPYNKVLDHHERFEGRIIIGISIE